MKTVWPMLCIIGGVIYWKRIADYTVIAALSLLALASLVLAGTQLHALVK